MRAGLNTFQPESTQIKASPKRENPIKTKDQYRLGHSFLYFDPGGKKIEGPGGGKKSKVLKMGEKCGRNVQDDTDLLFLSGFPVWA